ncbi:phosphatase PAP2 family protein [Candidatus Palauibacter sp.]|uniref:phosphatase PAP2 family protein n=1 Tax=Candidatus Palauibacter sp. TaxID=3101350 RepID=UPI003D10A414
MAPLALLLRGVASGLLWLLRHHPRRHSGRVRDTGARGLPAHRPRRGHRLLRLLSHFHVLPVAGPRYEFVQIGGEIGEGTLFGIVHGILETGSSKGTAFPSSHIAASLAGVVAAGREDRRWFRLLLVPELALTAGTVYGRFHYAVDALAGILLGLLVCAVLRALEGARAAEGGQPAG